MPARDLPDPAYLRQRLRYEPETGKLYWRLYEPHPAGWNTKWAGREAFTSTDSKGYRFGCVDRRWYRAHRIIWAMTHGAWPVEVDHEDHDKGNNRVSNLREVDDAGNNRNQSLPRDNKSGRIGVCWNANRSKWQANLRIKRRTLYLGLYDSFDDAVAARAAAEIEHDFHPNHGAAK